MGRKSNGRTPSPLVSNETDACSSALGHCPVASTTLKKSASASIKIIGSPFNSEARHPSNPQD
eukprot:5016915-Karenia_brevis.AAC.1